MATQTLSAKRSTEVGQNASAKSIESRELPYQQLQLLNEHCFRAIELITILGKSSFIPSAEVDYHQACLEEVRSSSSQCVVEALNDMEIRKAAKAGRKRSKAEKKLLRDTK